jgi:hypothetical protein
VYIPIRPSGSAYDVFERPRPAYVPMGQAPAAQQTGSVLSPGALHLPTGKDVSRELDVLFTRLAARTAERRSEVRLHRDAGAPGARSSLISSGQLNPDSSSYGKVQLSFGSSSSVATLSGSYAGGGAAAGATALKVGITQSTALGANPAALKFTVSDQAGAVLFSYDGLAKAGQAISLGTDVGLQIAFSAGTLLADSNASTTVSRLTPTQVDMSAQFDDPDPNRRPRFEGGGQVVAGSFKVNGQVIEVRAGDSISAVLARISENVPDIEASFANDRVRLASRSQSRQPIVVEDDSSGFLAATRLAGGIATRGSAPAGDERLSLSVQFARVQAGAFRVGGQLVTVDPGSDTLGSVLARMRQAAPSLVAYVDAEQRVVLRGGTEDRVTLDGDSSGFLEAAGLTTGRPLATRDRFRLDEGTSKRLAQEASSQKSELVQQLLEFLRTPPPVASEPAASQSAAAAAASSPAAAARTMAQTARTARAAYDRDAAREAAGRERIAAAGAGA